MRKYLFFSVVYLFFAFPSAYAQEEEVQAPPETLEIPFPMEDFQYSDEGRRDPFIPLIQKSSKDQRKNLINIENIYMIGTMESEKGIIALVKEKGGKGHLLKKGDPVAEGKVEEVGSDFITFILTQYGLETRRTLRLREGKWYELEGRLEYEPGHGPQKE